MILLNIKNLKVMSYIVEFGFNWLALFLLFSLFFIFIGLILINIYIEEKCLFIRYSPILVTGRFITL